MIRIGALFCDCARPTIDSDEQPAVQWVLTAAETRDGRDQLAHEGRLAVVDQLADFGVGTVRLEEGGRLADDDLEALLAYASSHDLSTTLRVDGRKLDVARLQSLAAAGLDRLSVLVPGLAAVEETHADADDIDAALATLEASVDADLATELRFPLRAASVTDVEEVYDLAALLSVDRFRLTHVPADPPLGDERRRRAIGRLIDVTRDAHERDTHLDTVLSGGIDASFVAEYAAERLDTADATMVRETLQDRLGASPSPPVAKLGPAGAVYPGPFWEAYSLGSVRDRPFGAIWTDETNPLLRRLRHDEAKLPKGCRNCEFGDICSGGSRGRALQVRGDPFAPDPVCYADKEDGVSESITGSPAD